MIRRSLLKNHVILADPAGSLYKAIEFEKIPKDKFIERWKNGSGEFNYFRNLLAGSN